MLFEPDRLSLGIVLPTQLGKTEDFDFAAQIAIAKEADRLGFSGLWVRDVPLNGDGYPDSIGHSDPWVLLGALAQATTSIQLITGAVVLPLRHPLHVAKAALSMHALSGSRFVLGLGSGDRPSEFAMFGQNFDDRKEVFRERWVRLAAALGSRGSVIDEAGKERPEFEIHPRSSESAVPLLAVGSSSQSLEWIARNAAGWATYYRPLEAQLDRIGLWHTAVSKVTSEFRSFSQSMVLDLADDPDASPEPLGLGMRIGRNGLIRYLNEIQALGAHHIMFNIAGGGRSVVDTLQEISEAVMPQVLRSNAGMAR